MRSTTRWLLQNLKHFLVGEAAFGMDDRRIKLCTQHAAIVGEEKFHALGEAINVGLESFYDSLTSQGAQAVNVEWKPPASGNDKMVALLARMKSKS